MSDQDQSGVGAGIVIAIVGIGVLGFSALFAFATSHILLGLLLGGMTVGFVWVLYIVSPQTLEVLVRWLLWCARVQ